MPFIRTALLAAAATASFIVATTAAHATSKFQIVYSFTGKADGGSPRGGLMRDKQGNLYGTAYTGGSAARCLCGTVYRLSPSGQETTLYSFHGRDGYHPVGRVVRNKAGDLFGVTELGGKYFTPDQGGVVFRLSASGEQTVLHSFGGKNDGEYGIGRLIMDADGSLYGVTQGGGAACDCGVVYKLAPDGTYTLLHRFTGGSDGGEPYDGLIMDSLGNLYGTASSGGKNSQGVVFKIANVP